MAVSLLGVAFGGARRWRGRGVVVAVIVLLAGVAGSLGRSAALAETSGVSCTLYASSAGNDSNPGSASAPLRTVKTLIGRLAAGQTGCLVAGQTFSENVILHNGESHGAEGAPVTITSTSPENPALISGRFVTETGADWLTFTHLRFTFNENAVPSPTVGSKHTTWTYDDVTAPHTICFNLINSSWGLAEHTLIEHDRIHGCGSQEKFVCNENTRFCETPPNDGFFIHGVYVGGAKQTIIRNNYIYENADRAVQIRSGSDGVTIEHNIMDANGEGIIYGDGAIHATARWNIITNSHSPCGEISGCYDYGASEYNAVAPNLLANNDLYANQCANPHPACYPNKGNIETMTNVTVEHNLETDPQYTNPTQHNYTLQTTSPLLGYGPDTAQPGVTSFPEPAAASAEAGRAFLAVAQPNTVARERSRVARHRPHKRHHSRRHHRSRRRHHHGHRSARRSHRRAGRAHRSHRRAGRAHVRRAR
jgi:hypothetical protein